MMVPGQDVDDLIERKIRLLKDSNPRLPEKALMGRNAFLTEAEKMSLSVSPTVKNRHNNKENALRSLFRFKLKEKKPMLSTLTAIIIAISVLLGGSGITVAAAQNSLPDDFLYDLKLLSEDVYMGAAADPLTQFQISLSLIDRRGLEINSLIEGGEDLTDETTNRIRQQIEETIRLALNLPDDQVVPAFEQIQNRLTVQLQTLTQLQYAGLGIQSEAMIQTQAMIQERIQLLENGKTNILQLQEQLRAQEQLSNPGAGNSNGTPGLLNPEPPGGLNSESQGTGLGNGNDGSMQGEITPVPADGSASGFSNENCTNCADTRFTKTATPQGGVNGGGTRR